MKYLTLCLLVNLFACQPNVYFESAQPKEYESLQTIPAEFRGVYTLASDSSIVRANHHVIVVDIYYEFETDLRRAKESEHCKIADGGIYLRGSKKCIPYETIDEHLVRAKVYSVDTLFLS